MLIFLFLENWIWFGKINSTTAHFDFLCLLDDSGVEVEVWEDFIRSWKTNISAITSVDDGSVVCIDEHVFVDIKTCPTCGLVEGLEVLGGVEETIK